MRGGDPPGDHQRRENEQAGDRHHGRSDGAGHRERLGSAARGGGRGTGRPGPGLGTGRGGHLFILTTAPGFTWFATPAPHGQVGPGFNPRPTVHWYSAGGVGRPPNRDQRIDEDINPRIASRNPSSTGPSDQRRAQRPGITP